MMTPRRAIRISVLLACLWAAGCAGLGGTPGAGARDRDEDRAMVDQERAELARELTLYSD